MMNSPNQGCDTSKVIDAVAKLAERSPVFFAYLLKKAGNREHVCKAFDIPIENYTRLSLCKIPEGENYWEKLAQVAEFVDADPITLDLLIRSRETLGCENSIKSQVFSL